MDFKAINKKISHLVNTVQHDDLESVVAGKLQLCKSFEPLWDLQNIASSLNCINNLFSEQQVYNLLELVNEKGVSDNNIGFIIHENAPFDHFATIFLASLLNRTVSVKFLSPSTKLYLPLIEYLNDSQIFNNVNLLAIKFDNCESVNYLSPKKQNHTLTEYLSKRNSSTFEFKPSALVLNGSESPAELKEMAPYVFNSFGRSQFSIHKIYIPKGYRVENILDSFADFYSVMDNNKYANNYEYHRSVFLMNSIVHLDNGFLLLKSDESNYAPTGMLYYQDYESVEEIATSQFFKVYSVGNNKTVRFTDICDLSNGWNWKLFFNKLHQ